MIYVKQTFGYNLAVNAKWAHLLNANLNNDFLIIFFLLLLFKLDVCILQIYIRAQYDFSLFVLVFCTIRQSLCLD